MSGHKLPAIGRRDETGPLMGRGMPVAAAARPAGPRPGRAAVHHVPSAQSDRCVAEGTPTTSPGALGGGPGLVTSSPHIEGLGLGSEAGGPRGPESPPASPTPRQAAWIRANAWPEPMRKAYEQARGSYTMCACQYGPTGHCLNGHCDNCGRGTPLPCSITRILRRGGKYTAYLPEPYTHKTDTHATGPRRTREAMVWYADRKCRWLCTHSCHHTSRTSPKPPTRTLRPAPDRHGQLDLFEAS